jgi:hypothetical protein
MDNGLMDKIDTSMHNEALESGSLNIKATKQKCFYAG